MKIRKFNAYGIRLYAIRNRFLPPENFAAINLILLFVRDFEDLTENILRHEAIHTLQAREMLYIPHLILYGLEYLVKFLICWDSDRAYKSISTEQEAYLNSRNLNYRHERKHYAFVRYIFKMYKK